jgi:hypothetical protein
VSYSGSVSAVTVSSVMTVSVSAVTVSSVMTVSVSGFLTSGVGLVSLTGFGLISGSVCVSSAGTAVAGGSGFLAGF